MIKVEGEDDVQKSDQNRKVNEIDLIGSTFRDLWMIHLYLIQRKPETSISETPPATTPVTTEKKKEKKKKHADQMEEGVETEQVQMDEESAAVAPEVIEHFSVRYAKNSICYLNMFCRRDLQVKKEKKKKNKEPVDA